jgi:hypothetical protein
MQPAPKKTDTPAVWPIVIARVRAGHYGGVYMTETLAVAMAERDRIGRERYGVGLQVENGRDALRDALEEALDLCAYTAQVAAQTKCAADEAIHNDAVAIAGRLVWRMVSRGGP